MALHQASGRWKLGLLLALVTAACWATLPVALKITLEQVDPITLTWFRFLVASLVMFAWLAVRGGLAQFAALDGRRWALLAIAGAMLIGNYVFYLLGVEHTSPANAQLLIQLAPLLMALGGIFVFREPYRLGQWIGLGIIVLGLCLFFRDQLQADSTSAGGYLLGSAFVLIAAVVWAVYALIQKQLLLRLSSPAILLFIYALASIALLPFSHPSRLSGLDAGHWALLGYCALNTLIAYGAFAEALAHWEASRVSAILATTPLLCLATVAGVHALWPLSIASEAVTALGYAGAVLVVMGSTASSLLGNRKATTT
ncbi:DMT family transporter [Arenimonas sp.]|uniref:DMT family transporter n=1 Tax=Arenimonas sp. TaxID=1872635 RepID=UPI0039E31BF2